MKRSRDLFILGAGASKDYGFPLGNELKTTAIKALKPNNSSERALVNEAGKLIGYDVADVSNFITELELAVHDGSIDEFIEAKQDLDRVSKMTNIAKVVIALLIISRESDHNLKPEQDWYDSLFTKLYDGNRTISRFFKNKIGFVTFNYDRSLERHLLVQVCERFNKTEEEASAMLLKHFPIIHVHGDIGHLWKHDESYRDYGKEIENIESLVKAAKRVRLVTDKIKPADDPPFRGSRRRINNADIVHFIGFRYHINNMQRLGFDDPTALTRRDDKFFGTLKGLSQQDIARLYRDYQLNRYRGNNSGVYSLSSDFRDDGDAFMYISTAPFN